MLADLLSRSAVWSEQHGTEDADYCGGVGGQRAPEFFWMGCSDGRVPANVVAGLDPGEVFVHRNEADVIHSADLNMLSALEFAVDTLKVKEVIVCGHYGCGGVKAATEDLPHGLADHWLEPIRRLARAYAVDLAQEADIEGRRDKLAELNVIEGGRRVAERAIIQRAWQDGGRVRMQGLIYGLKDGLLRDLDWTVGPGHFLAEAVQ